MNKNKLFELLKKSLTFLGQEKSIKKIKEAIQKDENSINALARGMWTILNEKKMEANNQLNAYLNEKFKEYEYLSNLDVSTIDKNSLKELIKSFKPVNREYVIENLQKINDFNILLNNFNEYSEEIFKGASSIYKDITEKKSKNASNNINYYIKEVYRLELLAKGALHRATKDDSMEL
jgi:hypothetical protein